MATQAELDAAYDNRTHVPDWRAILDRWAFQSAWLYDTRSARRDIAYGPDPRHRMDFFPASRPGRPTMLYIHGGYWQWLTKEEESFVANGALAQEINVALCEYRLCPEASFDELVADIGMAADWLAAHVGELDGNSEGFVAVGSSAGAHLAATLLGRPGVKAALLISGIYDLEPLTRLSLNKVLKLNPESARRNSPILRLPDSAAPVCFAVGEDELPEMIRQTADYAQAWLDHGLTGWRETIAASNHFTIMDHLADPDGILTRALLKLCQRSHCPNPAHGAA